MRNRILSFDQEEFLLKCVKLIETEFESGTHMIYQWDLQREKRFVYRVLSDREYDILEDSDRLNSIRNLYGYIKKGVTTSN
jgi:uncharacterized protein YeeX (DUF496 family)